MKTMKKLVLAGLVLLASVMVLVGCKHEVEPQHVHTYGEWKTIQSPTEEKEGSKERVCGVCSYSEIKEIEKVPAGFVYIPEGEFQMGSKAGDTDNKPVHKVTISKGFFMGECEVTQWGYLDVMGEWGGTEPSETYGKGDDYPAYNVSWYDAVVYCNKRSLAEGLIPCYTIKNSTDPEDWETVPTSSDSSWNEVICDFEVNGYRLPTEAEWEYAARAGNGTTDTRIWSGTDKEEELGNYAWYRSNSDDKTHVVGETKPNGYGLCDMSGNVWEWCWNWYTEDGYDVGTEGGSDPKGASSGEYRVGRGGGWDDYSGGCAVSYRSYSDPYDRGSKLGFRVVCASSK